MPDHILHLAAGHMTVVTRRADGAAATRECGEFEMKSWQDAIVTAIRAVKADQESLKLQNEFFEKAKHPIDTRP